MARSAYLSDLSDADYARLAPHLPLPSTRGRPRVHPWRELLDGMFYVVRTFSWLGQSRRLSKDYERLCETGEALIVAAMSRLMLRRLARPPTR